MQMTTKQENDLEEFYTLETGTDGLVRTFVTMQEFQDFLENELTFWSWLNETPTASQVPGNPYGIIINGIRQVSGQLPAYSSRPAGYKDTIKSLVDGYIHSPRIPLSGTNAFRAFQAMRNNDPVKCGFAISAFMGQLNQAGSFPHLSAVVEYLTIEMGLSNDSTRAGQKALEERLTVQNAAFETVQSETRRQRQLFSKEKARVSRFLKKSISIQHKIFRGDQSVRESNMEVSLKSFSDTEAAFREQMKLRAPVEYWSIKSKQHNSRAKDYRNYLIGFAIVGGIVLVLGLLSLSNHAIEIASNDKPNAVYIILATLGVVCSTIVFWVARILTRLFLSEHHLAIDSEERSTMLETYLALTLDGKVTDSERGLVLASLFRPTSDGIVKDDGAPEFSPASIISKIAAR